MKGLPENSLYLPSSPTHTVPLAVLLDGVSGVEITTIQDTSPNTYLNRSVFTFISPGAVIGAGSKIFYIEYFLDDTAARGLKYYYS